MTNKKEGMMVSKPTLLPSILHDGGQSKVMVSIKTIIILLAILISTASFADDNFPYGPGCKQFGLKKETPSFQDAAEGVSARESFELRGLKLHDEGKWLESNCFLIHAVNLSSDHALNLYNTIGFNYAALGQDNEALEYFEDATGYGFDLDGWVEEKKISPFNTILNKPVYKEFEKRLYAYYKAMGLDIPK